MLNVQKMNLDLIRTFVVLGQSKNMSEVSTKLGLDISNVSRHIKSLETIMNSKLVIRDGNGLTKLTKDGEFLFKGFEKSYNLLLHTEKSYVQSKDKNSEMITLGSTVDVNDLFLLDKIRQFSISYSNVFVKNKNLSSADLFVNLTQCSVDFIIDYESEFIKKDKKLSSILVWEDNLCVASLNDIKDIYDKPLIVLNSGGVNKRNFKKYVDISMYKKNVTLYQVENYTIALSYVKKGIGAAIMPVTFAKNNNLFYKEIEQKTRLYLSYYEDYLTKSSNEFLKLFK